MEQQYNMRNPAVKRLMKEAQELKDPTEQYFAQPLEDNLFEWHFTIRGPAETEFEGGIYHGRIVLPPEYPMKPPSIILLTPQGRFELNTKICLSISGHHPESWRPSWSIRTALLAIIGFMPTHGGGAIGSLNYTPDERKVLARKSRDFHCDQCGHIKNLLKPVTDASKETEKEAKELASQINFQGEQSKQGPDASKTDDKSSSSEQTTVAGDQVEQAPSTTNQQPSPQMPPFPPGSMPPLPPGMTPEMFQQMMSQFMTSFPNQQQPNTSQSTFTPPFPLPPPGVMPPFMMNPYMMNPHNPNPLYNNSFMTSQAQTTTTNSLSQPQSSVSENTQLRQRLQPAPAAPAQPPPQNAPRIVRRVDTQVDYVSFTIVLLCCLAIALIMIRRYGLIDMDLLRQLYDTL